MEKSNLPLGQRLATRADTQKLAAFFEGLEGIKLLRFKDDLLELTSETEHQIWKHGWPEEDSTTRSIQLHSNLRSNGAEQSVVQEWLSQTASLLGTLVNSRLLVKNLFLRSAPWAEISVSNSTWLNELWAKEWRSHYWLQMNVINPETRILLHIFPDEDFLYTQHRHLDL